MSVQHNDDGINPLLDAAIAYARRGWRVLPLRRRDKRPLTSHGLKDATTDVAVITKWWTDTPEANLGVVTGPESGVWVVDADGQAGIGALTRLAGAHGGLHCATVVQTGGDGQHLYFQWPAEGRVSNRAKIGGVPIDCRGMNGYVVAPPSIHQSGQEYRWLAEGELIEAPGWLLDLVRGRASAPPHEANGHAKGKASGRPDAATRARAYLSRCEPAISGQGGHARTFEVARAVVWGFALGQEAGYQLLASGWNQTCQPPWSEAELRHKCEDADRLPYDKPRGYLLQDDQQGARPSANGQDEGQQDHAGSSAPSEEDIDSLPLPEPPPWPVLRPEALHGLPGEFVRTVLPQSEADPAALLVQLLVAAGNAIGPGPYFLVEGTHHRGNLNAVIVGNSAVARKGSSWGRVSQVMGQVDSGWYGECVHSGLSSGEGLIHQVRDPVWGPGEDGEPTVLDEGATDKRLLVVEDEFGAVLRVLRREGNTLSTIIRSAWDGRTLATMTRRSPLKATGAHVSVIAHVTAPELRDYLDKAELFGGFANRFLWALARRSKLLPHGGLELDLTSLVTRLRFAAEQARMVGLMTRSPEASRLWAGEYPRLTQEKDGLHGVTTSRGEAQTLRLSLVYALLDGGGVIQVPHLRAALAVWDYCSESARIIFGDAEGRAPLADRVLALLEDSPAGLNRRQLHKTLGGHVSAKQLVGALARLRDRRQVQVESVSTGGRPAEIWKIKLRANEQSEQSPPKSSEDPLCSFARKEFDGESDDGAVYL